MAQRIEYGLLEEVREYSLSLNTHKAQGTGKHSEPESPVTVEYLVRELYLEIPETSKEGLPRDN